MVSKCGFRIKKAGHAESILSESNYIIRIVVGNSLILAENMVIIDTYELQWILPVYKTFTSSLAYAHIGIFKN